MEEEEEEEGEERQAAGAPFLPPFHHGVSSDVLSIAS